VCVVDSDLVAANGIFSSLEALKTKNGRLPFFVKTHYKVIDKTCGFIEAPRKQCKKISKIQLLYVVFPMFYESPVKFKTLNNLNYYTEFFFKNKGNTEHWDLLMTSWYSFWWSVCGLVLAYFSLLFFTYTRELLLSVRKRHLLVLYIICITLWGYF